MSAYLPYRYYDTAIRVELGLRYRANSRRHLRPFRQGCRSRAVCRSCRQPLCFRCRRYIYIHRKQCDCKQQTPTSFQHPGAVIRGGGAAMRWTGGHWAKSRGPLSAAMGWTRWALGKVQGALECRRPRVPGKKNKNNVPVAACETFNRFADFGL